MIDEPKDDEVKEDAAAPAEAGEAPAAAEGEAAAE